MKIVIAKEINKELENWQKFQTEQILFITWTSEIEYSTRLNEVNLYDFIRNCDEHLELTNLPFTKYQILNYSSVSEKHQFEFKNFNGQIVNKIFLSGNDKHVQTVYNYDDNQKIISVDHPFNNDVGQQIIYDDQGDPMTSRFVGPNKKIEIYWQRIDNKLTETGMMLTEYGESTFYNSYWDWQFEEFYKIIAQKQNITEIISYELPALNSHIKSRRVEKGSFEYNNTLAFYKSAKDRKKWIIRFDDKNHWKPRNDAALFASLVGYHQISFDKEPYIDEVYWIIEQLERHCKYVSAGDLVIWQYPMCSAKLENAMLSWFHDKGVFIVSFIHDLTLIRYDVSKLSGYDSEGDKHVLTRFDANIVPQKFSGALNKIASVSLKNVISPEPYDFRINHTGNVEPASYDLQVVYAGSLSKFPDINNIDFDLTVFGEKNFSNINITNDNLHDGGFIPAEDLAQKLDKGFGLIWDEDADNVYRQNYTKWNWPYKFSLYMASGLPVIAWKHSAIAEIIESYQLGVIVESLSEISNVISGITPEEFHIMAEHAATFGNKLIHGESTKKAVKKLELMLSIM